MSGNWDFERDEPKRNNGNVKTWKNGNGSIIEAYYAYEDAKKQLEEAIEIEDEIGNLKKRIKKLDSDQTKLESDKDDLISRHGAIEKRDNINQLLQNAIRSKDTAAKAKENWPTEEETLNKLVKFQDAQKEKNIRASKKNLLDLITEVKDIQKTNSDIQEEIAKYPDWESDYKKVLTANNRINEIKGELTSAKLRATIHMEGGYRTIIRLSDGSSREINASECIDVDGFIKLHIPGVASIQVAPQELDVDGLMSEETEKIRERDTILAKYSAASLSEISDKIEDIAKKTSKMKENEKDIQKLLASKTVETYQAEMDAMITDDSVVISDTLEDDIKVLLDKIEKPSLEQAIGSLETTIERYKELYSTQEKLAAEHDNYINQIDEYNAQLQEFSFDSQMTKHEYDSQLEGIKKQITEIGNEVNDLRIRQGQLSEKDNADISELKSLVEEKKREWEHEKQKYEYYKRIQEDFNRLRSESAEGFDEFYDKFNKYLELITGEHISLKVRDECLSLQSKSNEITSKELLSEGTKKTLLLAFRLAVLEYFFPNGGGFIVLDDDLLDMDPDRRKQSAKLLNSFAKNNQVIFTTCDPAIADLLGGYRIQV